MVPGEVFEGRELEICNQGQTGLLKEIHDQTDACLGQACRPRLFFSQASDDW